MTIIALTQARVIDCTGKDPIENASVIVEDERIKEIVDGPLGKLSNDAKIIDCKGQTLLPGLIDAHVHVASIDASISEQQRNYFPSEMVVKTVAVIKETLDQGFTTVRDCGGADPGFRNVVSQGLIPGPRLFVSGRFLSQTGGHADWRLPTELRPTYEDSAGTAAGVYDGVSAVRRAAREQIRQGVDFIKVMAGGGAMSHGDEIDMAQYSLEELAAVVFEAENAGKYVAAHCYSDRSIANSIKSGVRSIEHGNFISDEVAQSMRDAEAYLVPTIAGYEMISSIGRDFGIPENNIKKINKALDKVYDSISIALRNGVKIGFGSDLLGPMQIYKGAGLEFQARAMGAMETLIAATVTNAELINQSHNLGTIEAGKLADLILVNGDPLKNIGLFREYEKNITMIMKGGLLYKNSI